MKNKNHTRAWLEGKPYHCIRNEMLGSHAWKAASHLQRSMVLTLLYELGKHGGRDNGNLVFTNKDFEACGFSRASIKPNLAAIEALGFAPFKRGRPGTRGYGKARRFLLPFMPIVDDDGNETEPPSDPWARFSTTKEAKQVARAAYKRASSSKLRCRKQTTRIVVQKSDHVADEHNQQSSAEKPMNAGSAVSENRPLSRSKIAYQSPPVEVGVEPGQPWSAPRGSRPFSRSPKASLPP
jgi:hypothetical protein